MDTISVFRALVIGRDVVDHLTTHGWSEDELVGAREAIRDIMASPQQTDWLDGDGEPVDWAELAVMLDRAIKPCPRCHNTGRIAVYNTTLSYAYPGPVPEDARGVAEMTCDCVRGQWGEW